MCKKVLRFFLFCLLGLALVLGQRIIQPGYASGIIDYPDIPAPTPTPFPGPPKIKLTSPQNVSVRSNKPVEVPLVLKNIGFTAALNLVIQATADNGAPFTLAFPDQSNLFSALPANASRTANLTLTLDRTAKSGSYTVTVTSSYKVDNGTTAADSDTFTVRVETSTDAARVSITSFAASQEFIGPGESFTVSALVANAGVAPVTDVTVDPSGLDNTNLFLQGSSNSLFLAAINGGTSVPIQLSLAAAANARPGTYPITFNLRYRDSGGVSQTDSFVYYVNISGPGQQAETAQVRIAKMDAPAAEMTVGQVFTIGMELANTGAGEARDIKVSSLPDAEGAIVPRSTNVLLLDSLSAGASTALSFQFSATAKAGTQNYTIGFQLEYETGRLQADGSPETVTAVQYAGVNISNPQATEIPPTESPKASKPKIIVSQYETDPGIVMAGQQFDLHLVFENTHSAKAIQNIKIVLAAVQSADNTGSVFTPVNGSDTIFIDSISPKGTYEKTLRMYTVPNADPRTYTINVKYDYQDEDYNDYTDEETIGISVKQVTQLETSEITVPSDGQTGVPISFGFSINNTGKVNLSNLSVTVTGGDFDTSNANTFLGVINKGNSVYYDGMITPLSAGTQEGTITVSAVDDNGAQVVVTQDFSVNVTDMSAMEGMDGYGGYDNTPALPDSGGPSGILAVLLNPFVLGGAGLVVVIVIVGSVLIARRRRKRRLETEE